MLGASLELIDTLLAACDGCIKRRVLNSEEPSQASQRDKANDIAIDFLKNFVRAGHYFDPVLVRVQ
jgi:hypothetical protein